MIIWKEVRLSRHVILVAVLALHLIPLIVLVRTIQIQSTRTSTSGIISTLILLQPAIVPRGHPAVELWATRGRFQQSIPGP